VGTDDPREPGTIDADFKKLNSGLGAQSRDAAAF
jgi:hypothetical protein